MKALAIACAAYLLGWFLVGVSAFAGERKCYPLATHKLSFKVVHPAAKQSYLTGGDVNAYLDAYNNHGEPTRYAGDGLLLNVMRDGTNLMVVFKNGQGCTRILVGPNLHRFIMTKLARAKS